MAPDTWGGKQSPVWKMGGVELTDEQLLMDQALASIYNQTDSGGFGDGAGKKVPGGRGAGNGPSAPVLSKWLGDVRTLFDKELVTIIQSDAMERCGLKQLLFEPELLENLEPDMNLASMILALKDQIPGRSKDQVRAFISRIVEEINRLLADDIRRAGLLHNLVVFPKTGVGGKYVLHFRRAPPACAAPVGGAG